MEFTNFLTVLKCIAVKLNSGIDIGDTFCNLQVSLTSLGVLLSEYEATFIFGGKESVRDISFRDRPISLYIRDDMPTAVTYRPGTKDETESINRS